MALFNRRSSGSSNSRERSTLPAVTTDDFDALVVQASHACPILVDFWAPWCRPCKAMDPALSELASRYGDRLRIVAVDIQSEPGLASRLQILSIPLLMLYRGGVHVGSLHGAQPKRAIAELIEEAISHS